LTYPRNRLKSGQHIFLRESRNLKFTIKSVPPHLHSDVMKGLVETLGKRVLNYVINYINWLMESGLNKVTNILSAVFYAIFTILYLYTMFYNLTNTEVKFWGLNLSLMQTAFFLIVRYLYLVENYRD